LAQKQAQWLVGRNPFAASVMYGEGYDWTPLYSVRSGQMVGALPVGIQTKGYADAPYWPMQTCWTYKEVWTQPVGQWIWLMEDISVAATVRGIANAASHESVEFREQKSSKVTNATPNTNGGEFESHLMAGHYEVSQGALHTSITVLPGRFYELDLRSDRALDFKVTSQDGGHGEILLRVSAEGAGPHTFAIRTDNLDLQDAATKRIELSSGGSREITWRARVLSAKTPWVAVIVPDEKLSNRRELTGYQMSALSGSSKTKQQNRP
jgi:hypothetical protein